MSKESTLEQRLVAVERAVRDIQRRLIGEPIAPGWIDGVIGSISDPEAFREALEQGRAFRAADRPADEAEVHP